MPIYPNELAMENKPQRLGACFAYAFLMLQHGSSNDDRHIAKLAAGATVLIRRGGFSCFVAACSSYRRPACSQFRQTT